MHDKNFLNKITLNMHFYVSYILCWISILLLYIVRRMSAGKMLWTKRASTISCQFLDWLNANTYLDFADVTYFRAFPIWTALLSEACLWPVMLLTRLRVPLSNRWRPLLQQNQFEYNKMAEALKGKICNFL